MPGAPDLQMHAVQLFLDDLQAPSSYDTIQTQHFLHRSFSYYDHACPKCLDALSVAQSAHPETVPIWHQYLAVAQETGAELQVPGGSTQIGEPHIAISFLPRDSRDHRQNQLRIDRQHKLGTFRYNQYQQAAVILLLGFQVTGGKQAVRNSHHVFEVSHIPTPKKSVKRGWPEVVFIVHGLPIRKAFAC